VPFRLPFLFFTRFEIAPAKTGNFSQRRPNGFPRRADDNP